MGKEENKRSLKLLLLLLKGVAAIVVLLMIILYFITFNNGLSVESDDWGNFGAYIGSVMGFLAFAGVLYSAHITKRKADEQLKQMELQHKENSDRDLFFKMLDLHINKVPNMEFHLNTRTLKGVKAFEKFVKIENNYLKFYMLQHFISIDESAFSCVDKEIIPMLKPPYKYQGFKEKIKEDTTVNKAKKKETEELDKIVHKVKENMPKLTLEEYYDLLHKAANDFNSEYIHNTGHYFRNLYYTMKITKELNFKSLDRYKSLLRAQLSKYEIFLSFYNAMSSKTSKDMIDLLIEYKIFNNIDPEELLLFNEFVEFDKGSDRCSSMLNKLLEKSKEKAREGKKS